MARHRKSFCLLVAIACGLFEALSASPARAYEDQASVDLALGYTLLADDPYTLQGASLELGVSTGISDTFVARGMVGYAALLDGHEPLHLARMRVEALYLLDVLQVVPFLGLGISLTLPGKDLAELAALPGGHLVLGIDYLATRSWTIGLDVRTGLLIAGEGNWLSATDVSLRLSRMFETF